MIRTFFFRNPPFAVLDFQLHLAIGSVKIVVFVFVDVERMDHLIFIRDDPIGFDVQPVIDLNADLNAQRYK